MAKLLEDVVDKVYAIEEKDGVHDLWRKVIMKFCNQMIGHRGYTLHKTVHFGLRLPSVVSSVGDVEHMLVSTCQRVKARRELRAGAPTLCVTYRKQVGNIQHPVRA